MLDPHEQTTHIWNKPWYTTLFLELLPINILKSQAIEQVKHGKPTMAMASAPPGCSESCAEHPQRVTLDLCFGGHCVGLHDLSRESRAPLSGHHQQPEPSDGSGDYMGESDRRNVM